MALKTENFINGDIFSNGMLKEVTEKEDICLALLDAKGNILAYTDKIGSLSEPKILDFVSKGDSEKGGGTLTIKTIDAKRTNPNLENQELEGKGVQATRFLIAEWDHNSFNPESGSLLDPDNKKYVFPKGTPKKQLICGALSNGPYISVQTSFQFNKSTIDFSIS